RSAEDRAGVVAVEASADHVADEADRQRDELSDDPLRGQVVADVAALGGGTQEGGEQGVGAAGELIERRPRLLAVRVEELVAEPEAREELADLAQRPLRLDAAREDLLYLGHGGPDGVDRHRSEQRL